MLDKTRDFGTVRSETSVSFYQDGRFYDHNEKEVTEAGLPVKQVPVTDAPLIIDQEVTEEMVNDTHLVENCPVVDPVQPPMTKISDNIELESMPYQKIKGMVEQAGGMWTNKIEGIKYLRGM